jgi:hypothetical protein
MARSISLGRCCPSCKGCSSSAEVSARVARGHRKGSGNIAAKSFCLVFLSENYGTDLRNSSTSYSKSFYSRLVSRVILKVCEGLVPQLTALCCFLGIWGKFGTTKGHLSTNQNLSEQPAITEYVLVHKYALQFCWNLVDMCCGGQIQVQVRLQPNWSSKIDQLVVCLFWFIASYLNIFYLSYACHLIATLILALGRCVATSLADALMTWWFGRRRDGEGGPEMAGMSREGRCGREDFWFQIKGPHRRRI